jgi:hypothetical protein
MGLLIILLKISFLSFHASPDSYAFTMIVVGILSAIGLTLIALIGAILGYTRITRKKTGTILS